MGNDSLRRITTILNRLVESDIKAKRSKGFVHVKTIRTETGSGYVFKIPIGLDHKKISRLLDAVSVNVGRAVEFKFHYGVMMVQIFERDFPKVIPFKPSDVSDHGLLVGYNRSLESVHHPLGSHLLIGGASNSGKTDLIRVFNYCLTKQKYEIYMCDLKGISFFPFDTLPNFHVVDTLMEARNMLQFLVGELEKRKKLIQKYRDRSLASEFTPYAFIGDEAAVFASRTKEGEAKEIAQECENMIAYMGQQSREFKIFSIMCYQRPDMQVVNLQYRANIESSIALRTRDAANSRLIIDQVGAEKISPSTPGRLLYNYGGIVQELQAPYGGNDSSWEKIIGELQHERQPRKDTNRIELRSLGIHASIGGTQSIIEPSKESVKTVPGTRARWTHRRELSRTAENMESIQERNEVEELLFDGPDEKRKALSSGG